MIRAAVIFWHALRVRYLGAVLSRIPITEAEWARTFWELMDAQARLDAAWNE